MAHNITIMSYFTPPKSTSKYSIFIHFVIMNFFLFIYKSTVAPLQEKKSSVAP
jgi:hypothetical protein